LILDKIYGARKMKFRKFAAAAVSAIFMAASVSGCVSGSKDDLVTPSIPEGSLELNLDTKPNGNKLQGFGAQFDAHIFTYLTDQAKNPEVFKVGQPGQIAPIDDSDWNIIASRVADTRLQTAGVMIYPEWYVPYGLDSPDFTTQGMLALKKTLDVCQANHIYVTIRFWGTNADLVNAGRASAWNIPNWRTSWCGPPKSVSDYCTSMVIFVQWAVDNGYTCVKELAPYVEPNWAWTDGPGTGAGPDSVTGFSNGADAAGYLQMCATLSAQLKQAKLRDKIKLDLDDCTTPQSSMYIMNQLGANYPGVADVFNTHSYDFMYSSSNDLMSQYSQSLGNTAAKYGVPHAMLEFGSGGNTDSHISFEPIDSPDRGTFVDRFALDMINGGTVSLNYWVLYDQIYQIPDYMMKYGLWQFKDNNWNCRPVFYAWSLLTRYSVPGSDIYPTQSSNSDIAAAGFKSPDGKWSIFAVNSGSFDQQVSFIVPQNTVDHMTKYTYDTSNVPTDNQVITTGTPCAVSARVLTDTVKAGTVLVYTEVQ